MEHMPGEPRDIPYPDSAHMVAFQLSHDESLDLINELGEAGITADVRIGFDFEGVKISVNRGRWSLGMGQRIEG